MDILIGLGLLAWSVIAFVWGYFFSDGITSQTLIQAGVAGAGALVILLPKITNLFLNIEIPKPKPKPKPKPEEEIELDGEKDYNDFKALNYLKDRASEIGSKEAFELVVKLNTLIFSGKEFTDEK